MPPAPRCNISLVFHLAGRASILTNMASPCIHHMTWQRLPKQLSNPTTKIRTSHQHWPHPVLRAGPGSLTPV